MLRVLIGIPLRVRPPLGAFRRLCAEPEVLAGPGGDGQGARLDGHPRDDLGLAVCPGRLCLRPRLQCERAECELRADACKGLLVRDGATGKQAPLPRWPFFEGTTNGSTDYSPYYPAPDHKVTHEMFIMDPYNPAARAYVFEQLKKNYMK